MKLRSVDIGKTTSAASIVFDSLRQAIIEGELDDGDPLRQDEIAALFNTSRIPVREALTRLEQHGLVENRRYRGAVVAGISVDEAAEIFDFRSLLEGEVIAASVSRMTPASLLEARRHFQDFMDSDDPLEWGELNRRFHYALYRDSGLTYHLKVIDNALDRVERYLRAQLLMTDGLDRANREHLEILEACEAGDASRAAECTRQHIQGAKRTLIAFLETRANDA
ncbi:GntR family transcriptional regulator [Hoeflea poritis]|uniref:GntR family transcriptional regulator n=1 Tax=Hoeflea poritis TaxID=2993659 RepID=A0ABT4VHJ3_9HYPH|nr:GntR family transcriptional regulator [Hoeflea poritis]MDA4844157.1 GntR family transcriptional regulator [Hoeflea poritis]